jgi:3-oxoacyl-[acyl-carrier protein] reductase
MAILRDLLSHEVRVATFARTVSPELAELVEKHPDQVFAGALDVTDVDAGRAFVLEAEAKLGPIDGMVNNAAIGQDSLHAHTAPEQIARIIETNLTAPLVLTRYVVRRILGGGRSGRIVNITSICAQRGFPGLVTYSATKGGMDAATRSLARELRGRMLVNSVAPGFFRSELSSMLSEEQLSSMVARTPSGHLTEPEEILPVVRMLLLEHTNINGQVITIDGASTV